MDNKLDQQTLKHLKETELMILKDVIDVCDKHDIDYYLFFGTLIGAVRHEGFIPWDDDIDIMMFREDYEKFLKIFKNEKSDKYEVLEGRCQDDYFLLFAKISLKDTKFEEYWAKQVSFNLGIFIDIFILDNVPDNKVKRFLFKKYCFMMDKLLTMATIRLPEHYPPHIRIPANAMHGILNRIGLDTEYFKKRTERLARKYENQDTEYVCDLTEVKQFHFRRSDLKPAKIMKFEDIEAKVPNNYDYILKLLYGDYMKIPPEEERTCHVLDGIEFGEY
ncbi:MAG: LicD family protein [Methanobrevibacter sp.]|uniref:LicD family protein n=1 Tax=Methanobrevibacter sp. TaxID=66852 RepID=UPI0026E0501E|nr:LicD family protein [Methanobrevibacter sp.]MDO5848681.1 LicD family protein [Methanobrevibacter sp.]